MEFRRKGKEGKLIFLLSWPEWPGGLQGVPAFVGDWDKMMTGEGRLKGRICMIGVMHWS